MTPPPIVVYTAAGQMQAQLIKSLLEAAGIHAELSQEGAGAAFGFTVGAMGMVDILVAEAQAAQARALLAAMERGELETNDEAPSDDEMS